MLQAGLLHGQEFGSGDLWVPSGPGIFCDATRAPSSLREGRRAVTDSSVQEAGRSDQ